jgi:hypothetical protein
MIGRGQSGEDVRTPDGPASWSLRAERGCSSDLTSTTCCVWQPWESTSGLMLNSNCSRHDMRSRALRHVAANRGAAPRPVAHRGPPFWLRVKIANQPQAWRFDPRHRQMVALVVLAPCPLTQSQCVYATFSFKREEERRSQKGHSSLCSECWRMVVIASGTKQSRAVAHLDRDCRVLTMQGKRRAPDCPAWLPV